MADPQPLVSVIATCCNHERFVVECLESIRAQTYPNVQLTIMDDCSSDGSVAIIRSWLETTSTPATFITHAENRGICRTRNEALTYATGDYVATVSTDDAWLPEKLAVQVEHLERLPPEVGVVFSDAQMVDEGGWPLIPATFINNDTPPDGDIYEALLEMNFIPSLCTVVRRRCLDAVGPYDESLVFEDWDMWLRLSRRYRFAFLPGIVARYRVLPSSLHSELLGPRRAEWEESLLRIDLKHLGYTGEWDRVLIRRVADHAEKMYELGHPRRSHYLRLAKCLDSRRRTLALHLLARSGVPYGQARWLIALLSRLPLAGRLSRRLAVARGSRATS